MAKRAYGSDDSTTVHNGYSEQYVPKYIKPKKTSKKTYLIFGGIVGVLLLIAIVFGVLAFLSNKENKEVVYMWDSIREVASEDDFVIDDGIDSDSNVDSDSGLSTEKYVQTEGYSTDPMDREIDFSALKEINSDVVSWIYVPGTNIDYPVLQEQKFGETFYLNHNIYKVSQSAGCIFMPAEVNDFDLEEAHLLLFGHRMKNTSMFSTLLKYKQESFYKEYPYFYLYYPDHTERWSIFSVQHVKDTHKLYDMPYEYDTIEYEELLASLVKDSMYKTFVKSVKGTQKTATLSTCDNIDGTGTGRFTVTGVIDKSVSSGGVDLLDKVNHSIIPQANGNTNILIEEDDSTEIGHQETLYKESSDEIDVRRN